MAINWENPMRWDNTGSEPSEELMINGFSGGYKPPAAVFNYFLNKGYACTKQLQEIVGNMKATQEELEILLTDIDCGYFEENIALAAHLEDETTHENLSVDGNASVASETGDTLAEHEVDSTAHQNILLDGNES